jgi:tetratricopeptide (TPR) repeat protein
MGRLSPRRRLAPPAGRLAVLAVLGLGAAARADDLDDVAHRLTRLETQAATLEQSVQAPNGPPQGDPDLIERHLVQAQVAYGTGRYGDAALLLYDIVERFPGSRSYGEARFYLADSLFMKGDNVTARDYFVKIIAGGAAAPHYQEALERLLELTVRLQDPSSVRDLLARLDQLPPGTQLESVPYARGKFAYVQKNYDEAIRWFDAIKPTSRYYFQGRYYAGVTYVARGDLGAAAKVLHALTKVQPKNDDDNKVVELTQLALGRIHYERDQPADAIDHYLTISRHSPYFDGALYEVAWVYVKAKEFDKALRALELLALANPKSAMLPDVRILEGNLRIRKAQTTAVARGNSAEEYSKANQVFDDTRAAYEAPRKDLERIIAEHDDPHPFFAQVLGRAGPPLETKVELPEVVVTWMKEVSEVQRAVGVTKDLDEVRQDLDDTATMIARLERAVDAPSRVALFPVYAEKRGVAQELADQALRAEETLTARQHELVGKVAGGDEQARLAQLDGRRVELTRKLAALPGSGDSAYERVRKARAAYLELDKKAQQVEVTLNTLDAQLVALDIYYKGTAAQGKRLVPEPAYQKQMAELRQLAGDARKELDAIRSDILAASDEAGVNDSLAAEELAVRKELTDSIADERELMGRMTARLGGDDRAQADRIATLEDQAQRVTAAAARTQEKIDRIVDGQLGDVKATIVEEKGKVAEYRQTLAAYDGESGDVGAEVVAGSFDVVSKKFYEIGVRADVGLLDVSWSQKEMAQQSSERLQLDYAHEKTQIENEIRSIQREEEPPHAP